MGNAKVSAKVRDRNYQAIKDTKLEFSDLTVVIRWLTSRTHP